MKKIRSSKKGFTLAELLIVVAIIGVLVGISIPIFTAQLNKSKAATNQANARAAKAAAVADYLDSASSGTKYYSYNVANGTIDNTPTSEVTTVDGTKTDKVAETIGVTVSETASGTTVTVNQGAENAILWTA